MLEDYYKINMPEPSKQIDEYIKALKAGTIQRPAIMLGDESVELVLDAIILYLDHRGILGQKTN